MKFFYLAICIFISISINAQFYDFSHINNSNGLSSNQVEYIFKDSRGFIWFATSMGLNRYDGINFKTYKNIKNDPSSSPTDIYSQIQEDSDKRLWLKYNNELQNYAIYELSTEKFILNTDSVLETLGLRKNPTFIVVGCDKNIYCHYNQSEIGIYDCNKRTASLFKVPLHEDSQKSTIMDMKVSDDFIWLLYKNGTIERINKKTKEIDFRNSYLKDNGGNPTILRSLFIDNDQDVWVYPAISDMGAAYYNFKRSSWCILDSSTKKLSSNFVRTVIQDHTGLIWIGTDHGGLNIYDKRAQKTKVLERDIHEPRSIGHNSIISLFCDNEGIVWVGTYKNGVSFYHPDIYKFKKNAVSAFFNKKAQTFDCNSLLVDHENNLWIGTDGQGLIKYNSKNNEIKVFTHEYQNSNSISTNIVTSLFQDHSNTLWIGTFLGGLNSLNNNQFTRYSFNLNDSNSLSSKSVYGLGEDKNYNLWIGTLGGGVDMLDPTRKTFTHYNRTNNSQLYSDYILSIFSDKEKNLYLSSDLGINMIDRLDKKISILFDQNFTKESLTSNTINNFYIDSRGLYWIASNKGLNIYNPANKSLMQILESDGLPNEDVVSVIEDNSGNIWARTRNGLVYIYCQMVEGKLDYYITHFNEKDGLPSNVCNLNAIYKDRNGIIYVGFTKGYTSFDPAKISSNNKIPQPRFTDLFISNQAIKPNIKYNDRVIIDRTISDLQKITLNHNETNFTIKFSALSFQNPTKNHYKYKLEGLDQDWTEVKDGIGSASYSNLNAGQYKLIVYASNGDNTWSEQPLEMTIIVRPPFWLSWWAFSLYFIAILLIIRVFIKWKLNKQKKEFEQAQRIMEAEKTHEVDELKFRFFTNISHEFKTPLTMIMTPIEKLLKEEQNEEKKTILNMVYRNAQNLLKMVNDILDFRRFDLNKMSLSLRKGNIIEFVRDICQSFSPIATNKSINLTFTTFINDMQMQFDAEKVEKILSNLLSNAFKYTDTGSVDVSVGIRRSMQDGGQDFLSVKVSDTGIGISDENLTKIFERFYRVENSQINNPQGTGIGLHLVSEYIKLHNGEITIESTVGKGTTVTFFIPISNTDYAPSDHQEATQKMIDLTANSTSKSDNETNNALYKNLPTLLVVDDNEDFCRFIQTLFDNDYRVITAHDGQEGYTIVLDQLPDIILCDVMMPVMDGYEFCRKVKADIRTSHIPIILLTAKSSEENQYIGLEAGADDYIAKPFNIDMLTLKISKIIERQKVLQSKFKQRIDISPSEIEIKTMDEKFVEKAIAIVEENIGNPDFLVEDLCKEMGMSRVYFYKKTLALTDKTPSEFIRFIRLKRAAALLEKSQMFVNEVAFQVGFNDPKYFRKYFKEEFGVTPNEYKKHTSK